LRQDLSEIIIARIEQLLPGTFGLGFRNMQKMAVGRVACNATASQESLWKFKAMLAQGPFHGIDVLTVRKLDPGC
jgi:hypothetical protein